MNTMIYDNYNAEIEYDDEDKIYFGHISGIRDIVSFHGDTLDKLKNDFHMAVDNYLAVCKKIGKQPQKPCQVYSFSTYHNDELMTLVG